MHEDALARVDLFSSLRWKELTEVAKCCRVAKYSPGLTCWPCSVTAYARPSNEPPSNW